jgi:carboxyl-terminal processing protease
VAADPREKLLAQLVTVLLTEKHLTPRPIDDAVSRKAFPRFLEQLDGSKLLLLTSHVAALKRYEDRMDDQLRAGDLVLARKAAAMVASREKFIATVVADILSKPFDFKVEQETENDPEKLAFCKSEAELRDRWTATLKLQALERIEQMEQLSLAKSADKGRDAGVDAAKAAIPATFEGREEKARKDLATRYEARFQRLAKLDPIEPVEQFLGAIAAAFDPHTVYMAPASRDDFDISITGRLEGIGAALGEQDHFVVVQELVPGGASWQQGKLEAGDLILAVAQQGKPAVDVTDMPLKKVVSMIRGPKDTVVTLTVKKPDGRLESISITRDVVKIQASYARGAVLDLGPKDDATGYVYLPGFYGESSSDPRPGERSSTDDVRALLAGFEQKKLRSVILDLRGNGGGFLTHASDISGLFIERGPIVQTRDAKAKVDVLVDRDPSVAFSGDVVVLVDRFSASASEIVAGALQDYGRAVIVGTGPTHGKGTVQGVVPLDELVSVGAGDPLGVFKITTQQYFRVSGESTQIRGVKPDVVLPDPMSFVESGEGRMFNPTPWAALTAVSHGKTPHAWSASELSAASQARVKANPVFTKIDALGALMSKRRENTRERLVAEAWFAERKRDKEALEAADPKLKELKPLFEVQVVPDRDAAVATPGDKKLRNRFDAWKDELARDPWIQESLFVLRDMGKKR